MGPEERKPLPGARSIVAWRRGQGWAAAAAAALLAASLAVTFSAWRHEPIGQRQRAVPPEVVACLGGALAVLGLVLLRGSVLAAMRTARLRQKAAENPEEPWLGDFEWSPRGIEDSCRATALRAVAATMLVTLLLVPINVWTFTRRPSDLTLLITVLVFDLAVPIALARALYLLGRHWSLGVSQLAFRRFPFFTGSKIEVGLSSTRADFRAFRCLVLRLRLVEEVWEKVGRRRRLERTQLYFDELELSRAELSRSWSGVQACFRVPRSFPGTQLSQEPVRYWELEAQGEAPRRRYRARFLLPVYTPPRQLVERLAAALEPEAELDLDTVS
jgi:hypothetical protein